MDSINERKKLFWFFILFSFIGFLLRIWVSQFGYNQDFSSWQNNLSLYLQNKSVYEFGNYIYSPVFLYVLSILDSISIPLLENSSFVKNIPGSIFRIKIIIFLSFLDFFIFFTLYKKYSLKIGLLFFLNPICIIITGHHNQFNNFGILFGFLAVLLYQRDSTNFKFVFPLIIMGFSLAAKHILIFFPFWWAFKEKELIKKFFILFIPYSIFILSFWQFLPGDFDYVVNNVLYGWRHSTGPFWGMFAPKIMHMYFDLQTLFSLILIGLGFLLVNKSLKESFFLYLMAVVIFSSMMYTQYLVIPVLALAIYWNWKFLIFTILTFLIFLVDGDQLNIHFLREFLHWDLRSTRISFYPIILILLIGFVEISLGSKKFNLNLKRIYLFFKGKIKSSLYWK
tara:strand:+ start:427 stop:1611 length:1185 start_codon:yes stop_codon:yes gene_type:complete